MKILMINVVCGIRSTGRICTDLATALEAQGHEVKIAYGRESVPEQYQKYAVRIGTDVDVKLHALKARLFDACGWGSKRATEIFIEWVKAFDPDVIHLHNLHGYYINVEVLFEYLRTCEKRIIWTLHDCWAFTGHCTYYSAVGCQKWINNCCRGNCINKNQYPKALFSRAYRNYIRKEKAFTNVPNTIIVTPSKWLSDEVKKSFMGKYPIHVVYNGVNTSIFSPKQAILRKKFGMEGKKIVLGVASTWDQRKGLNDFIALAEVAPENMVFVIIGVTIEQKKKLPQNVIGITKTNNAEELAEWYSTADIFLNTSKEETFGMTTVEAINCGTPSIVFEGTALSEIAKESQNVYLVNEKDQLNYLKIIEMIKKIKKDASKGEELFTDTLQVSSYLQIYEMKRCL